MVVLAPGQQIISQPVHAGQPMYYVQAPPAQMVQYNVVPVQSPQPVVVATSPGTSTGMSVNMGYVGTAPGILKIIEFVSRSIDS